MIANLKTIGRCYWQDNLLHFNFSASGFEFWFEGEVKLEFVSVFTNDSYPVISIIVGDTREDIILKEVSYSHILRSKSPIKVQVLKRTESSVSRVALKALEGDIYQEAETKTLSLEFYGDSITCGYGVLGKGQVFKTWEESALEGYAYRTAKLLNANWSLISVSGYPIYRGIWNLVEPVKNIYEIIDKADYYPGIPLNDLPKWDNGNYKADYTIINLGTNDETWFTSEAPWVNNKSDVTQDANFALEFNRFKQQVKDFIFKIRSYNPTTKIIYAIGILKVSDIIVRGIKESITELDLSDVYFVEFNLKNSEPGANFHPGLKMQEEASEILSQYIKRLEGM